MAERFDVVVVGAGPAGLSAGLVLARGGANVLILERGEYPGSKNVMGGVLYNHQLDELIPGGWREAPIERNIIEQNYWLMTRDSAVSFGYRNQDWAGDPPNCFTVLRAKFDQWFAKKVEEAGATLITRTTVVDLLQDDDGRVVGVRAGRPEGEVYADVVILAEGVNNLLTQKAGLHNDWKMNEAALAVKEVIELPREKIEDRFGLEPGQGATIEMLGDASAGMLGMGFLYTNKESLSLGVGVLVKHLVYSGMNPNDLLERLKQHPKVRPLIEGGRVIEYSAKLIPEGGYKAIARLFKDGVMVVGDAAGLTNAIHREGSNLAMTSGRIAGEVALEALAEGDPTSRVLRRYQERLEETYVLKDLRKYNHANEFFDENPQFLRDYPELLSRMMREFFTVDSTPKWDKQAKILRMVRRERPLWRIAYDLFKMWRAIG
ncbi:MAG TPA: FAD-dependent oxidoreductase [Thermaerobacter sp.]